MQNYLEVYKQLGNKKKYRIIRTLIEHKQLNVNSISDLLAIEQSSLSHILKELYYAGMVTSKRKGKFIFYSANEVYLKEAINDLSSLLYPKNQMSGSLTEDKLLKVFQEED